MQPTFALALRDANGVPNITKQFSSYDELIAFVNQSADNAPMIMALVQQEGSLSYSLVPVAFIRPGISMINEEKVVKQLEPTTLEVEVLQTPETEPAPLSQATISSLETLEDAQTVAPQRQYTKVGKRRQGKMVAGKHK